jgi:hypothetical protein
VGDPLRIWHEMTAPQGVALDTTSVPRVDIHALVVVE